MKAVVVYESLWGNTAAIAKAIAEGLGTEARALTTSDAQGEAMRGVDLIVAGAPLLGFNLPNERMRESIRLNPGQGPTAPDLTHPMLRTWMASLPKGSGHSAAFETRLWWSPGGATVAILSGLEAAGYLPVVKGKRFMVTGRYGPLRRGEIERAHLWGAELARAMKALQPTDVFLK